MERKSAWSALKQAFTDFSEDDALTLAGSLAFYGALALSPLIVLLITVTSYLGEDTQRRMIQQTESVIGPQASQMVNTVVVQAKERPKAATIAGILGLATLAFSATGAFAQLQHSLNRIWDVRPKPGKSYWVWIRKRLIGILIIILIGVLLLASVIASAVIGWVLPQAGWVGQVVDVVISFLVLVLLFAVIFKYLPDVNISWTNVWAGSAFTALLFVIGKYLIGLYLGHSSVASPYGAAGSLIVLLLWLYYSSAIFFLGAELTQAYAHASGRQIKPSRHAEWLPEGRSKHRHAA